MRQVTQHYCVEFHFAVILLVLWFICSLSVVLLLLKLTGALDSIFVLLDDALVLHASYFIYICLAVEAANICHFHHKASWIGDRLQPLLI